MSETPTPRTDALVEKTRARMTEKNGADVHDVVDFTILCRTLERELAEARASRPMTGEEAKKCADCGGVGMYCSCGLSPADAVVAPPPVQGAGEPVAMWRYRGPRGGWIAVEKKPPENYDQLEPLYTTPPVPNAAREALRYAYEKAKIRVDIKSWWCSRDKTVRYAPHGSRQCCAVAFNPLSPNTKEPT